MRLAFVTSLLPTGKPDTGFDIANAAIIRAFRDAGATIVRFGVVRPDETPADERDAVVLARMDIENAVAGPLRKAAWLADGVRRGLPVISAKIAPLARRLDQELDRHGPFDAIVVNSAPVAAAFPALFDRAPCLLVAHNVEHLSAAGNARGSGGLTSLLYRREARLLETAERKAASAARFVFCLAAEDATGFGTDLTAKSAVFPLLTGSAPLPRPPDAPAYDIGLIGTWTWRPNFVGLRWFLDEVAPRLPGSMSVAVAGRLPSGLEASGPNVALLGRVADAAAFVGSCRCMALTSRAGTGVQLKSIETFEMGRPAVATIASVRGIDALPPNCLVADEPEQFAAALGKLVNDIRAERTLPMDGRVFVERRRDGMAAAVRQALAALKVNS
jgi:hypothetical protein